VAVCRLLGVELQPAAIKAAGKTRSKKVVVFFIRFLVML
jgi:t-SNARE complex subunit (syntaxin)